MDSQRKAEKMWKDKKTGGIPHLNIIWVDANVHSSSNQEIEEKIRNWHQVKRLITCTALFENNEDCALIMYLKKYFWKIHLIISSGGFGKDLTNFLLKKYNDFQFNFPFQVIIFCGNSKNKNWAQFYDIIRHVAVHCEKEIHPIVESYTTKKNEAIKFRFEIMQSMQIQFITLLPFFNEHSQTKETILTEVEKTYKTIASSYSNDFTDSEVDFTFRKFESMGGNPKFSFLRLFGIESFFYKEVNKTLSANVEKLPEHIFQLIHDFSQNNSSDIYYERLKPILPFVTGLIEEMNEIHFHHPERIFTNGIAYKRTYLNFGLQNELLSTNLKIISFPMFLSCFYNDDSHHPCKYNTFLQISIPPKKSSRLYPVILEKNGWILFPFGSIFNIQRIEVNNENIMVCELQYDPDYLSEDLKINARLDKQESLFFNNEEGFPVEQYSEIKKALIMTKTISILNLRGTPLNNEICVILFTGINSNQTLQHIDLESTDLDDDCTTTLCCSFLKCKTIEFLNMSKNHIEVEGSKHIGIYLGLATNLEVLRLEFNLIGSEGCMYIAKGLKDNINASKNLRNLHLDSNNIQGSGVLAILESTTISNSLEYIGLKDNQIAFDDMANILDTIKNSALNCDIGLEQNFQEEEEIDDIRESILQLNLKSNIQL